MGNLTTLSRITFYPCTPLNIDLDDTEATGWWDYDVSAKTGTDTNKLWVVISRSQSPPANRGARAHGSSVANQVQTDVVTVLSYVDSSGHMDLYRTFGKYTTVSLVGYIINGR